MLHIPVIILVGFGCCLTTTIISQLYQHALKFIHCSITKGDICIYDTFLYASNAVFERKSLRESLSVLLLLLLLLGSLWGSSIVLDVFLKQAIFNMLMY